MKNINDDGKTFLTKGLGKSIKSDAEFPKFKFSSKLGENFLLELIKPTDEAIKRCELFYCELSEKIGCLRKERENYSLIKYHYGSELIKLLKSINHPYGTNYQDLLIRKQIRDLNEVIKLIESNIKKIEKVLTKKVKQYKNKQQKYPEEKKSGRFVFHKDGDYWKIVFNGNSYQP